MSSRDSWEIIINTYCVSRICHHSFGVVTPTLASDSQLDLFLLALKGNNVYISDIV